MGGYVSLGVGIASLTVGVCFGSGVGLLLGFLAGVLLRLGLITLQWEGVYSLGVSGILLFPSLIELNPVALLGFLVGCFAVEPFSAGMRFITKEGSVIGDMDFHTPSKELGRDGRVPLHMFAFYGLLITITLGVTLLVGWGGLFSMMKQVALPVAFLVNLVVWFLQTVRAFKEGGTEQAGKLLVGVGLSLGITLLSIWLFKGTDLKIYGVILPLVVMGLPIGKRSGLRHDVLPGMLTGQHPVYGSNIINCLTVGVITSMLVSTSQRLVTQELVEDPVEQYGVEAVHTYMQFALYWLIGWGLTGETGVAKVIESYHGLDTLSILLLLFCLCCVLGYALMCSREAMMFLVRNRQGYQVKTIGEVVCLCLCLGVILFSPNALLGLLLLGVCLSANLLVRMKIIPGKALLGALLLPYLPLMK